MTLALRRLALAALVLTAFAGPAAAQKKKDDQKAREQEAIAHYQAGQQHYNLGEFDAAVTEYKAAYALTNAPALLFNIAQAYRLKGDHTQALFFYRTYLREDPKAENAADVEALIAEEEKKQQASNTGTGTGATTGTGTGATTGTGAGTTGTGDTGDTGGMGHGDANVGANNNVGPREDDLGEPDKNVVVNADQVVVNSPGMNVDEGQRHPGRTKKILGLSAMGTGLLLGGVGLYFGKLASDASDEITGVSSTRGQWNTDHETTYSQGQNDETTEIVLLTGAGAFLAGGVVLYYLGYLQDSSAEGATRVSVVPTQGGAGMTFTCAF